MKMHVNSLARYFTRGQLFVLLLVVNHATLVPFTRALPIDAGEAVSDNEEVTTVETSSSSVATTLASVDTLKDESTPVDEVGSVVSTFSKREEPLEVKNDSDESSKEDDESTVDSTTSQLIKDQVTDQLASESSGDEAKGESDEKALPKEEEEEKRVVVSSDGEKDVVSRVKESSEEKGERSIEKESDEESKVSDDKSIIEKMWVKQGHTFTYPREPFTFKSVSPVHSSILILPLVSPSYQLVSSSGNGAASTKWTSEESTSPIKESASSSHVLESSLSRHPLPLSSSQFTAHQTHGMHNRVKDLFIDQLVSSPVDPFDSRSVRFTTAHSNSPMIPLLPFHSPIASAAMYSHHPLLSTFDHSQSSGVQFNSFSPVHLPTRWWHSYPSVTRPVSSSTVESTSSEDVTVFTTMPPTMSASDASVESAVSSESVASDVEVKEEKDETKEAKVEEEKVEGEGEEVKEEKTDGAAVNASVVNGGGEGGDVDVDGGDTNESGGRAKRQVTSEDARQVDAVVAAAAAANTGESIGRSTIDDVVKSIVASSSGRGRSNAVVRESETIASVDAVSAPSPPREDILKNGQGKKALQVGLEIASDILATIRDATSDATSVDTGAAVVKDIARGVEGEGESLVSSASRESESTLSSILSSSAILGHRVSEPWKSHATRLKDSGLFHVFHGVFGDRGRTAPGLFGN